MSCRAVTAPPGLILIAGDHHREGLKACLTMPISVDVSYCRDQDLRRASAGNNDVLLPVGAIAAKASSSDPTAAIGMEDDEMDRTRRSGSPRRSCRPALRCHGLAVLVSGEAFAAHALLHLLRKAAE